MYVKSHLFKNWEEIPDLSDLESVEDGYIRAFQNYYEDSISFVAYAIKDDKVVAFGSATFFGGENYYQDDPKDKTESERKLWVEGLVSIEKGGGKMVLQELELWLIEMSQFCKQKIINLISVDKSIGFYEKLGYFECRTCSRFAGSDNMRMAKPIGDYDLSEADLIDYEEYWSCVNDEDAAYEISSYIWSGRRKRLLEFIDLPSDLDRNSYPSYVIENKARLLVSENTKNILVQLLHDRLKSF